MPEPFHSKGAVFISYGSQDAVAAGRICDDSREKARLSFEGSIGTFDGWRALTVDDVCDVSAQTSNGRP